MKNYLVNSLLILFSIGSTLIILELFFRLIDKPKDLPIDETGWRCFSSNVKTNELGYRGQHINYNDSDIVVLLLGDSQVEALNSTQDSIPEKLLQNYLQEKDKRFKVFSVAVSGYGTDQQYLRLKEYFSRYRADYVLLWMTPANDITDNTFPFHPTLRWEKRTFWREGNALKGPTNASILTDYFLKSKIGIIIYKIFPLEKLIVKSWEKKLPSAYRPARNYTGKYYGDWDWMSGNDSLLKDYFKRENFDKEITSYAIYLYPRSARTTYSVNITNNLLHLIKKESTDNRAIFASFTVKPELQLEIKNDSSSVKVQKIADKYYISSGIQYWVNWKDMNESIRNFIIPLHLYDYRVSKWDAHLNSKANLAAMKTLADSLYESQFFQKISINKP